MLTYVHSVVSRSHPDAAAFMYSKTLEILDKLANRCHQMAPEQLKPIQSAEHTKTNLEDLRKRFVITPVDKASNNFALICPKLYLQIMNKELGVHVVGRQAHTTGNDVYKLAQQEEVDIIRAHAVETERLTGMTLADENKVTPILWASPKFHKNPIKFRFIAGAKKASTKTMSTQLATILLHMKEHWERYTTTVSERKGYNSCWPIDNSGQVIRMLRRNKLPENTKLSIADFSTLYTSFEHDIIIDNATELIRLLFKHSGKKYVSVGRQAYYHSDEKRKCHKYTCDGVVDLLIYLVKNSYVAYAGKIFHQTSGIPMGANYSPVLANLCLAYMEYRYLIANPTMGRRLQYTTRFIDDLLSIGTDALQEAAPQIYPASLPLSFDNTSDGTGHYLDLAIDRNDKSIGLFDKRKDFAFNVIRFTDASSNVPRSTGLNIMYSQALRLARICTQPKDFAVNLKDLCHTMLCKGYAGIELQRTLNNIRTRYPSLFIRQKLKTKRDIDRLLLETIEGENSGR